MTITTILLIGGGLVIVLLAIGIITSIRSERSLVEERLGKYLEEEAVPEEKRAGGSALTDWVNRSVERTSIGDQIARQLAQADLKFKPGEYIALFVLTILG